MAGVDRPWLYPGNPEYQTFLLVLAAVVASPKVSHASDYVLRANDIMDALEKARSGVIPKQTLPRQPRVQPVEGGLSPHHNDPFFRLPDGTLFYRGAFDNLVVSQPLNNCEVTIQRADVLDMTQALENEYSETI